ncbi:MAG: UTP--glucose-1-phosphate uridylyltransferase, partial [Bryobacteraceae bacterium]
MRLVRIITSTNGGERDRSVDEFCRSMTTQELLAESAELDRFWRTNKNLYERVRAQFFLYAIHRFHLQQRLDIPQTGIIPFEITSHLLRRRFEEAIELLNRAVASAGINSASCSAFAAAFRGLAFKTLAGQVRQSVRSVKGNQWMSRVGHPSDYPLRLRPELLARTPDSALYPILKESTPVRMDLTHSAWSDIFFLGMDFPEGAKVLNVSIDLSVREQGSTPKPPIEAYFRVIDEPVLRLTSIDLAATADITSFAELFDFGRDYL